MGDRVLLPTRRLDGFRKIMPHRPIIMPSEGIVFVVDDDVSVREAVAALIASAGLHVAAFESATSFLTYPAPPGPSCLVLDVSLNYFRLLAAVRD